MRYPLATETWTNKEKEAAKSVIDSGMCTMGKITQEFEEKFAEYHGSKYAVFSNSGSSANLLAVAAMFYAYDWQAGDEVIVPAVSWSTTYFPLTQHGLKLVFVDINNDDYNINIDEIEKAITPKTKAIMAVNLLGMPCDFEGIEELLLKLGRIDIRIIEDNCESMGATYNGKLTGTFGDIGTFSTFFSHHICSVEGGVCLTNDETLYHYMLSIRSHGWTRHLPDENHIEDKTGNPFVDSFRFVVPGYNLRNNDIFAAIAIEQLDKLAGFVKQRQSNADYLKEKVTDSQKFLFQNTANTEIKSSWFGFGFTINDIDRDELVRNLLENGIECRPIVAGNFVTNPAIKYCDHRIVGELPNANLVDRSGLFIGNNSEDIREQIDMFLEILMGYDGNTTK